MSLRTISSPSFRRLVLFGLSLCVSLSAAAPLELRQSAGYYAAPRSNDFSCRSVAHPNPVVMVHGLLANPEDDLNAMETYLENQGFCTFATVYGEDVPGSGIGGVRPIASSAPEIASFIQTVHAGTGASKVDLVGHSAGAFQVLYVPKFEAGISSIVDNIVAISPVTHGTTLSGIYSLSYIGGNVTRELIGDILEAGGCGACNDLGPDGPAVDMLNDGNPIKQAGNTLTIIISTHDEVVTPPLTAQPVNEPGVRNIVIQDTCPSDPVGHVGISSDRYVYGLVANVLDPSLPLNPCTQGNAY